MVYNSEKYKEWYYLNREKKLQANKERRLKNKIVINDVNNQVEKITIDFKEQPTEQPQEQTPEYKLSKNAIKRNKKLLKEISQNEKDKENYLLENIIQPNNILNKYILEKDEKKTNINDYIKEESDNNDKKIIIIQEMKQYINILSQKLTNNLNLFKNKSDIIENLNKINLILNDELDPNYKGFLNQYKRF